MSFLGAIGYTMEGSGLEEMWSLVYARESTKKMMAGHAFSRAVRAHMLSFTAIAIIICRSSNCSSDADQFIYEFFENWNNEPPCITDCKI